MGDGRGQIEDGSSKVRTWQLFSCGSHISWETCLIELRDSNVETTKHTKHTKIGSHPCSSVSICG
jgi:hypothetical protein